MANRAVTLDKDVFTISDLKREGSAKIPKMYRGWCFSFELHYKATDTPRLFQRRCYGDGIVRAIAMYSQVQSYQLLRLIENEQAYKRYKIRPRILVDVDNLDTSTEIFGVKVRQSTNQGWRKHF